MAARGCRGAGSLQTPAVDELVASTGTHSVPGQVTEPGAFFVM